MRATLRRVGTAFYRLSASDWALLARAQAALVAAQVTVWIRPEGKLVGRSTAAGSDDPLPGSAREAVRLGVAVRRAATYGLFRPLCLVRALALARMLEARGIRGGRLRIGVLPNGGKLLAHAWVEYGGLVLGDLPVHVRRFHPLAAVDVLGSDGRRCERAP